MKFKVDIFDFVAVIIAIGCLVGIVYMFTVDSLMAFIDMATCIATLFFLNFVFGRRRVRK